MMAADGIPIDHYPFSSPPSVTEIHRRFPPHSRAIRAE
jgi:hypothetical protein